jgi:disulfide bond formation protein DsbB
MTRPARGRGGPPTAAAFAAVAIVSFGAVAVALVSQHAYAIGAFALLGLLWRGAAGRRVAGTFGVLLALAGVASALWQHFVAAKSASCNLTLADKVMSATQLDRLVPGVFEARASCADAAVSLFGVPYAMWSALAFVVIAIVLVRVLRGRA